MKLKYIGWFFRFIWCCTKDLPYDLYYFNHFSLMKENWSDFKFRIHFDSDPEAIKIMNELGKTLNKINKEKNEK